MARTDPEAALALQAAAAQDTADYADLPSWCRPGATCWLVAWTDTTSNRKTHRATITKILKREVVVEFTLRNGAELTERVSRTSLTRHASGRGGAALRSGSPWQGREHELAELLRPHVPASATEVPS